MKIQFLGTAAAEGIPGMFCNCEICRYSKKAGGKNIRSRSQAIIDDEILIDFCPDTFWHINQFDIDTSKIRACFITHGHLDHLNARELILRKPGYAHLEKPEKMLICGSGRSLAEVFKAASEEKMFETFDIKILSAFQEVSAGDYTVTALPAVHTPELEPFIYLIEKDGKAFIYGTDTGIFSNETITFLEEKKVRLDAVAMDCTMIFVDTHYPYHMTFAQNVLLKQLLTEKGICDENTRLFCHHFSHNGKASYDQLLPEAQKHGFDVSYDGMIINI